MNASITPAVLLDSWETGCTHRCRHVPYSCTHTYIRWTHIYFVYQFYYSNDRMTINQTHECRKLMIWHTTPSSSEKECQYLHMYYGIVLNTDQMFCWWSGSSCPALDGWIAGSSLLAEQTSFLQDQSVCKLHSATGYLNINQILCFSPPFYYHEFMNMVLVYFQCSHSLLFFL